MPHFNILISGSGVAASVFSYWFLRAYPTASITIVERDPALRLTGASVDIRSSAVDIIQWMGVEQAIRDKTTKEQGMQFVHANGKPISTLMSTGRTDVQSMTSEFEIFRGELTRIFIEKILGRVKIVFDETVERYEQRDDKVLVTFTKSKETKEYDLLIAADGLGSRIRGMMLNAKPSEQLYDEGVHAAYFTIKQDLLEGSRLAKWHNASKGRVVFIRPDPNPAGRVRGHFLTVTTPKNVEMKARLNGAMREGNESYKRLMEELFADVGWLTPEVLRGMRESDDFYCSFFGQVRSPRLYDGRVVLLGDSGYATPGFGTSLAIMGAYALAGELLNHASEGEVGGALEAYAGIMQPFVKASQGNDNAMQYLNPQTKLGISIRNGLLGCVTGLKLDVAAMTVMGWLGITEKKPPLGDYKWPEEKV